MAERKQADTSGSVSEEDLKAGAVSNVMEYLQGLDFPATKDDVKRVAQENGADESALQEIEYLPDVREYRNPVELSGAIGHEVENLERAARGSRGE